MTAGTRDVRATRLRSQKAAPSARPRNIRQVQTCLLFVELLVMPRQSKFGLDSFCVCAT